MFDLCPCRFLLLLLKIDTALLDMIERETLEELQFFIELVEAICIEVMQAKSKPILIASVYRPPISALVDVFDKIEILMQNLDQEHKQIIILGDFNCDLLSLTIVIIIIHVSFLTSLKFSSLIK